MVMRSLFSHIIGCADGAADGERCTYGFLHDGICFRVPQTRSVMRTLLATRSWRSCATWLWAASFVLIGLTGALYFVGLLPLWFFVVQFVAWRLTYNIGLGCLLYWQSNGNHFVEFYRRLLGSFPALRVFLEGATMFEDTTDYHVDDYPDEFNAWMLFRQVENVVLANDLVSYIVLAAVCWGHVSLTSAADLLCIAFGTASVAFALWSKSDAHRVVGDFAWYWGDFFFLIDKNLDFNGIFQMFPHPMYTVGYSFLYGVPLMAKSYTLFYISVFAHLCQLAFLAFVENPHIDRIYNKNETPGAEEQQRRQLLYEGSSEQAAYLEDDELVLFLHFSPFRASDLLLLLIVMYLLISLLLPIPPVVHVAHCVFWRLFHSGCLGLLLQWESQSRWFSRHYASPQRAFYNWKLIYNASVVLTGLSYVVCAVKLFAWTIPVIGGGQARVLTVVAGLIFVALNAYVDYSVYTTLGDFGYFYGDFFVRDVPPRLNYGGIYRYLNNPSTSLGMAAFYGVALLSGSYVILALAVYSQLCVKLFCQLVEMPHMQKHYGAQIRRMGGLQSELTHKLTVTKEECESRVRQWKERMQAGSPTATTSAKKSV